MSRFLLLVLTLFLTTASASAVDRRQLKPGLIATYSATPVGPNAGVHYRLEPTVGVTTPATESPHPALKTVNQIRWQGYVQIITPGSYTFAANVQNSRLNVVLSVENSSIPVLNVDAGTQSVLRVGTPQMLEAKIYSFEATLTQSNPGSRGELLWQGPGFVQEPVPYYFFGHLPSERPAALATDLAQERGQFLFEELACQKCHTSAKTATPLAERTGPNLAEIGKRTYAGWLDAWLANPTKLRPATAMPAMFSTDERGRAERYAVVQYLANLGGSLTPTKLPSFSQEYSRSINAGQRLFTTSGCVTCHGAKLASTIKVSEDDEDPPAPTATDALQSFYGLGFGTGAQALYPLGAVGSKTKAESLQIYLSDPKKTNAHGRMPNMGLSGTESRDLARYLCRTTDETIPQTGPKEPRLSATELVADAERGSIAKLDPAKQWREVGAKIFHAKGCAACHSMQADGQLVTSTRPGPSLMDLTKQDSAGCLAPMPEASKVPVYSLDADARAAIAAYLKTAALRADVVSSTTAARVNFKRFGCLNCHQRDGEGGIGSELADTMKKLENAQNADDIQPPRLTGIGHKSQTGWLSGVLYRGERARPWMSLRMPQYGEANLAKFHESVARLEGSTPEAPQPKVALTAAKIEAGRKLAGKEGLGCIGCHDISGFVGGGTRGPDLARTTDRVRYDWNMRWMHNPQRITPGTRMPQNFNNGVSPLGNLLEGNADAQIDALWAYFALGPGLPLPVGMEPPKGLIIRPTTRPEILRTFMPDGAGTKAIAVGFPGGTNYVFDAAQCRLSYAWEGNFLDASPVWDNRGGAPAKLLGPKFLTAAPGNPWAIAGSRKTPDFPRGDADFAFGAPVPNDQIYQGPRYVKFEGYSLDSAGVPTFRYRVGQPSDPEAILIRDTPMPMKSALAAGLKRLLVAEVPAQKTGWLMVASGSKEPRIYTAAGEVLPIDFKAGEPEVPTANTRLAFPTDEGRLNVYSLVGGPNTIMWRFAPRMGGGWVAMIRFPEAKDAVKYELTLQTWSLPRDDAALIGAIEK